MKILLIVFLVGILVYFISRRFFQGGGPQSIVRANQKNGYLLIDTSSAIISNVTKRTLWTVGIGFVLFLITLVIGIKIKIILIALPLSLYLIAQLFVCTNHVKVARNQRLYFDPNNNEIWVDRIHGEEMRFNLLRDVQQVNEVKSVQANRGILFGYYELKTSRGKLVIPYLVQQNQHSNNRLFFDCVNQNFKIVVETKLFPII
ncbi:hypothetical protein [Sphingobacterium wenxiniae]|uniref:PH domain-containing protein n=1 Tax=Sphingobacterium wenxiniae TaxID=683125 RepID=A0A1I6PEM5_9SPHI|nr:hypothetical protein [Sphingobacterium wenxiniae]SFS38535.1 hypothetical protein SAMN05660206_101420 [Sphingobacterium wenxiniae]